MLLLASFSLLSTHKLLYTTPSNHVVGIEKAGDETNAKRFGILKMMIHS